MANLELASEYREVADKLISKFPVAFGHLELDKILFLKELEKSPKKYADIRKVNAPFTFMTEYKFIITFYEPVMMGLSEAQKNLVVHHELLHIDVDFEKIRKHNIEDFSEILSIYGISWSIDPNIPNILDDDEDNKPVVSSITSDNVCSMSDSDIEDEEPEIL